MGIPNYTYMMFKLPGPKGVITIKASLNHVVECDRCSYEMRMVTNTETDHAFTSHRKRKGKNGTTTDVNPGTSAQK